MAIVSLKEVVDELDGLPEGATAYVNRRTGELVTVTEDDARLVAEQADPNSLPAWQRDMLPEIEAVLTSEDWLPLPSRFEINDWSIMEGFCLSQATGPVRAGLLDAIHGRGAFRRFEEGIYRHGVERAWYRYRAQALERIAAQWLEENGIPYERREDAASTGEAPN
jgi:hypothetical protein